MLIVALAKKSSLHRQVVFALIHGLIAPVPWLSTWFMLSFFKPSVLPEQAPVLYFERPPDPSRVLHGVSDKFALLAQLEVNVFLVVLALDVRHVYGDEYVGLVALET